MGAPALSDPSKKEAYLWPKDHKFYPEKWRDLTKKLYKLLKRRLRKYIFITADASYRFQTFSQFRFGCGLMMMTWWYNDIIITWSSIGFHHVSNSMHIATFLFIESRQRRDEHFLTLFKKKRNRRFRRTAP